MGSKSSQKFIARNRAPRVQIEYDVEVYGSEKKVQLPFVMGVISDLSGKSKKPPVDDRKFLEIDVDNFDIQEAYSYGMSSRDRKQIRKIIFEHFDYIVERWQEFQKRR